MFTLNSRFLGHVSHQSKEFVCTKSAFSAEWDVPEFIKLISHRTGAIALFKYHTHLENFTNYTTQLWIYHPLTETITLYPSLRPWQLIILNS